MGLDMYLFAETNENSKAERLAYWRKANAIHAWFVENVQGGVDDCNHYVVTPEQLKNLHDLCHSVIIGTAQAAEKLPTRDGFFFGSTKYDDLYMGDLIDTVCVIRKILENPVTCKKKIFYQSSW